MRLAKSSFVGMVFSLLLTLAMFGVTAHGQGFTSTAKVRVADLYGKLPLSFERNDGQTDAQVKFLSRGNGYTLFLTPSETVLALRKSPKGAADVLRIKMIGANRAPRVEATDQLAGKSNYFIGNDRKKWRTNIPSYSKVWYRGVYPGIDLVYYGANQRQLEYDFVVAPGANPDSIGLRFEGAERLTLNKQGDVVLRLPGGGEVIHHAPSIYQERGGKREKVDGRCVMRNANTIGFELAGYDRNRAVYIDPGLVYSTYLGGSGVHGDGDGGGGIAVDSMGFAYVTGFTFSSNFPTTAGSFQTANNGAASGGDAPNAFVTKLNADGTGLVYSTYLGGSGIGASGDGGGGIAVDSEGFAYVTGVTNSSNFPTTTGAFQTSNKAAALQTSNAFVTKLNPDATALVYSTYLGGSGVTFDVGLQTFRYGDVGNGIAIDSLGFAYVVGQTSSTNFPTTTGAFQTTNNAATAKPSSDDSNAFVTKLKTDGSGLVYSTYLGGKGSAVAGDGGLGIALDSLGFAYATGVASSSNFPTTAGAFQVTNGAALGEGTNAFVTKLKTDGTGLSYSTYLGGSASDSGNGIAVDSTDFAYVAGRANSSNFPTTAGAFQTTIGTTNGNGFIAKLNTGGTALVYSTYLGGHGDFEGFGGDFCLGIALDSSGFAYVTGSAGSNNFPTTKDAFQAGLHSTLNPGSNAFVTELSADGAALVYSTYLGGTFEDNGAAIAVASGNVYVTGAAASSDFPTSKGAFQTTKGGGFGDTNAFVTELALGPSGSPTPSATATPTVSATPTISATPTASSTATPTVSATPTASNTATPTPTATPTATATATRTATATPTATPSATPTPVGMVSVSPSSLNFGTKTTVGKTSKPKTVTIKNDGNKNTGLPVTVESESASPSVFAVKSQCKKTLKPGKSCKVSVTFKPVDDTTAETGSLMIFDNVTGSPQSVELSGIGKAPRRNRTAQNGPHDVHFTGTGS